MNNSVIVDVGEKGKIIGIEILNFSHQQNKKGNLANLVEFGVPVNVTKLAPRIV